MLLSCINTIAVGLRVELCLIESISMSIIPTNLGVEGTEKTKTIKMVE